MGSSESKHVVASETKPELPFKPGRVAQLIDPRSPSAGIDRTPIQVSDAAKSSAKVKSDCPLAMTDPRSPSVGITRTPVREVMRATVGTFARRLGMIFHNDIENRVHSKRFNVEKEDDSKVEELASSEPLLTSQPSNILSSLDKHATMLATPMMPPSPQSGDSPFVLLEDPQFEVELKTEADLSLEEAEEAQETPLHKRLSMSLIACHEGAASTQIYESVNDDSFSTSECVVDSKSLTKEGDHLYAILSPVEPSIPDNAAEPCISKPSGQSEDSLTAESITQDNTKEREVVKAPATPTKERTTVLSPHPLHICCPTIDSKSPSQVVFKPQWLGRGFGVAGQKVKAQGKGRSSPLALHVAIKKTTNENKGQTRNPKQKATEGRSPLQVLKATNSPRDPRSQMTLKVSTPEKQRLAHTDRRVFAVAVDKENR